MEAFYAPREAGFEVRKRIEGRMLVIRLKRARFLGPLSQGCTEKGQDAIADWG